MRSRGCASSPNATSSRAPTTSGRAISASTVRTRCRSSVACEKAVEEDNWAAAAEWVEAMGADVISSSLGYLAFDRPYTSYSDRDLDGETAISTKAANMAIARGVVVVNAAGNGGLSPVRNTLIAPA